MENVYIKKDQDDTKSISVASKKRISEICAIEGITNCVIYHGNEVKTKNNSIPATTKENPLLIITEVG